eukprot:scaffold12240_cov77-Attheya_sp.AAC.1
MYRVLSKYGVDYHPNYATSSKDYDKNTSINLNVGMATSRSIPYAVGVKQGDDMAPILFLFLIQAFAERLEEEWEDAMIIDIPTFNYHENRAQLIGRLVGQCTQSKKGSLLLLNNLLHE